MSQLELIEEHRCFDGRQLRWKHRAQSLDCDMHFSVYVPDQARAAHLPVLYWLSGLTCTDENFVSKAGAQRAAAQHGVILVAPDTSPRGEDVPDDPDGAYDFGLGAGFYLNATQAPWSRHYHMEDYISRELPQLVAAEFPVDTDRCGIFGHSMGGHGAMTLGLKHPDTFRSISAFAPISSPTRCPWGHKALAGYLGDDPARWEEYDSSLLIARSRASTPILVDQGDADGFLEEQLKPELLQAAAEQSGHALELRLQAGFDHSYFFIASFIDAHIAYHQRQLSNTI